MCDVRHLAAKCIFLLLFMITMMMMRMKMAIMLSPRSKVKRSNTLIFLLLFMIMMMTIMRNRNMMKMVKKMLSPRSKVKRSPPLSRSSSNTGPSLQESQHHLGWASEFLVEIMIMTRSLSLSQHLHSIVLLKPGTILDQMTNEAQCGQRDPWCGRPAFLFQFLCNHLKIQR